MVGLSKDGTYVGNDVIVAISRCYGVDVVIHQLATPNWEVQAPPIPVDKSRKTVHIVYLRGEHYCSVRSIRGNPLPAVVSVDIQVLKLLYAHCKLQIKHLLLRGQQLENFSCLNTW